MTRGNSFTQVLSGLHWRGGSLAPHLDSLLNISIRSPLLGLFLAKYSTSILHMVSELHTPMVLYYDGAIQTY